MEIKYNLKNEVVAKKGWASEIVWRKPFLIHNAEETIICMLLEREWVFFNSSYIGVGTGGTSEWLEENYEFIRYLEPGESFTVTI